MLESTGISVIHRAVVFVFQYTTQDSVALHVFHTHFMLDMTRT